MYIPANSTNLKTLNDKGVRPQMRILLQGAPFAGKTYFAASFPNPIFLDFDNKMGAHAGKDIIRIPFYDADFVGKTLRFPNKHPNPKITAQPNRKDALKYWLAEEGPKLAPEQTLILDSWTKVQDVFDYQHLEIDKFYTKEGELDGRKFWGQKVYYNVELFNALTSLPCNFVIVICHEQAQRDEKTGMLITKIEPLQQGQTLAKMGSYFTDQWRQLVFDRIGADGKPVFKKDANGKDTREKEVEYYLQLRSTGECNLNCSLSRGEVPMYIKANFKELQKYL